MILTLYLENFRSYSVSKCKINEGITLIYGPNGSGKTNLLESISMLAPGNGFRGAKNNDFAKNSTNWWNLSFSFNDLLQDYSININYLKSRKVSINNAPSKSTDLVDILTVGWITPQIMLNFWRDNKLRRNFIDRLTNNIIPIHSYYCFLYEKARLERGKLIMTSSKDYKAYKSVEYIMSENGIKIIENRKQVIQKINESILTLTNNPGHSVWMKNYCTPATVNELQIAFEKSRYDHDKLPIGPHRSNLLMNYNYNNAQDSSTGQQIMSIIHLLMASLMTHSQDIKILLLDDIFSHLDSNNINILFNFIEYINPTYSIISNTQKMDLIKQTIDINTLYTNTCHI